MDPVISLQVTYKKKKSSLIQEDICTQCSAALFAIAKTWKQPECPSSDEWIKEDVRYMYTMEYYSHGK